VHKTKGGGRQVRDSAESKPKGRGREGNGFCAASNLLDGEQVYKNENNVQKTGTAGEGLQIISDKTSQRSEKEKKGKERGEDTIKKRIPSVTGGACTRVTKSQHSIKKKKTHKVKSKGMIRKGTKGKEASSWTNH